jgi:pimeloyl-ACP methyl ester carboxylesterase
MTASRSIARLAGASFHPAPPFGRSAARTPAGTTLVGAAIGATALAALAYLNHRMAAEAERRNPPAGRFVVVDGVRLHYVERGVGPALVLLHGNGAMIQDFAASGLIDAAAASHRVIAFDRPGFGHSDRPRGRIWTADAQAALIAAALRELGVERATVLGHSWGCAVALALALRSPDLVGGLVLASGYHFPSPRVDAVALSGPAIPLIGDVMRYTLSPLLARLLKPRIERKLFAPAPVARSFEDGFPFEMAVRPSQIRAAAAESGLLIPQAAMAAKRYRELRMPVVIVAGDGDRIVDTEDQSARLHALLPGSILHRVEGAGHMIHHTALDAVLEAIAEAAAGRRSPNLGASAAM